LSEKRTATTTKSAPEDARSAVTVVYIGGDGRSGSTLLELLLDHIPGFVALGELNYIWERGLVKNELCGCGRPFRECPFWERVGQEAFGGWDQLDPREMLKLERSVTRLRSWPLLFVTHLQRRSFKKAVAEYTKRMERLYLAAAEVSACPIVVDSSKNPCLALLLGLMADVKPRLVHMVRDSRGVAFSWTRHVIRSGGAAESYMPTFPPWYSSIVWIVKNLQYDLMKARGVRQLFLRYESLVPSTRREIGRVLDYANVVVPERDLSFLDDGAVTLGVNHSVSGNPMRFRRGRMPLLVDNEWRDAMSLPQRILVSVMTAPLLLAYHFWGG
jgi:sulfotransferase family protein